MTTLTTRPIAAFWICLLSLLVACASPEKLLETGNYDQAIEVAVRKLAGKKNKKARYVQALEEAFAQATERDMQEAERLKATGRPEHWERINGLYRDIIDRQNQVQPLLPLIDKEGIKANFRFVRVEGLERESREKAAAYLYDHAQQLIERGRRGDRLAAREAYHELEKISRYYRTYKDRDQLMDIAEELGTSYILVKVENDAPVILPRGFENEIMQFGMRDLDTRWKVYHDQPRAGTEYDYQAVMRLTNVQLSPEVVRERQYEDSREIQDGFDYVLDERGNVKKDSLGNDIKIPRKVTIRAQVFEVYQSKVAAVTGYLELIDLQRNHIIDRQPLAVEAIYENYASTFRGDERALSRESLRRIGNRPQPFPSDEALILTAAEQFRPVIKEKMQRTRDLI